MLLFGLVRRLLVLALILAIPLVAGELLVRKLLGDAVASAVRARLGVPVHIGLGSGPVLAELVKGRLDAVTVRAAGVRIAGLGPVAMTARLDDVHLTSVTSLQGAIGSLVLDASVPPAGVRDLLASPACTSPLPAPVRVSLTAAPRVRLFSGRIDLLPPSGRAAEVRLRPLARPGGLAFEVIGVQRGGAPVTISARTLCSRSLPALPFGARVAGAAVAPGALELRLAATGASFSALG